MSRSVDEDAAGGPAATFEELEAAVGRALVRIRELHGQLRTSEARRAEVEGLLTRMAEGQTHPADMQERIARLEGENAELRTRLDQGRDGVDRLLARIRFLEEQR